MKTTTSTPAAPAVSPFALLWNAAWPYPQLAAAEFASLYWLAATLITAAGYYEYEAQGYADDPGISVCGALHRVAELACAPGAKHDGEDPTGIAEELETRLAAVLYLTGQQHHRTGIRDVSDEVADWELGRSTTGPNPGQDKALALLAAAAAMFDLMAAGASVEPEPIRLDGCTCSPVRGSHRPPCPWAAGR